MLMFLTLFALNGCSLGGETIPKNRTKKQYEFEKTFEPIFKFLEQDKKDFTGLKIYISRVYIKTEDEVQILLHLYSFFHILLTQTVL